jgi:hypothetical protein
MTRRVLLCAVVLLVSPMLHAAVSQDLTGTWTGSFVMTMNGQENPDTAHMVLKQEKGVLTGTAGPNVDQQWTILNGKVDGAKVTFDVQSDGPLITFTLTLADGRLKGDARGEMDGQVMTAKVDVGRTK